MGKKTKMPFISSKHIGVRNYVAYYFVIQAVITRDEHVPVNYIPPFDHFDSKNGLIDTSVLNCAP